MKVLFVTSEITSLYKVGGLGDFSRDFPIALHSQGVDIRLVMPFHPEISPDKNLKKITSFQVKYANRFWQASLYQTVIANTNIPVYLICNDRYISAPSGFGDSGTVIPKFSFFDKAVVIALKNNYFDWKPDCLHLNDWHSSLLPLLLKKQKLHFPTLLTIHNLNFQGKTHTNTMKDLGLTDFVLGEDGEVNILQQGLRHADYLVPVSPQYAQEIQTPEYGAGLSSEVIGRKDHLLGILNGIDTGSWDPETDPLLTHSLSLPTLNSDKKRNKQAVLKQLNLEGDIFKPLLIYVGRVDGNQKGMHLFEKLLSSRYFSAQKVNFVFLGTGDSVWEAKLQKAAENLKNIRVVCRFDEALAHQLYAGGDCLLMPSKYDPCGLVQLIAMHYGTIPVAYETGGLKDTILDGETGFLFSQYTYEEFTECIDRALEVLKNPKEKLTMQIRCMQKDVSWKSSVGKYIEVYKKVIWGNIDKASTL